MQLFTEHILLNHREVPIAYLRRLQIVSLVQNFSPFKEINIIVTFHSFQFLKSGADFQKAGSLTTVKKHLNHTIKEVKKKK